MSQLAGALAQAGVGSSVDKFPSVADAYGHLRRISQPGDRIVVLGSFHTVGEVMRLETSSERPDTLVDG